MPGRFLATVVAVFASASVCAPSAAAVSITFDGEVLRYRAPEGSTSVGLARHPDDGAPTYLVVRSSPGVDFAIGCGDPTPDPTLMFWEGRCPLGSAPLARLRYRFSLEGPDPFQGRSRDDHFTVSFRSGLRGVVYAGAGNDKVERGDRVYGGTGHDELEGARVYGGRGSDLLVAYDLDPFTSRPIMLRGGPGPDLLEGRGYVYGGPGNDELDTATGETPTADMFVGGPGKDLIQLGGDNRRDVVRVRGGGVDHVNCLGFLDPGDALFVDRSDRLSPSCNSASVLFAGRPRYPYP